MYKGEVYTDNGVTVIRIADDPDFIHSCWIKFHEIKNAELTIVYRTRCWRKIMSHTTADSVNRYDVISISNVMPGFVDTKLGHWEKYLFGLWKKWIPEQKRLKKGWVEFQTGGDLITVVTKTFRIVNTNTGIADATVSQ